MKLPWQVSDLHPHALSLDEEALDRSDFAEALVHDLAALSPPDVIHRYRVIAQGGQAVEALKQNGFTITRLMKLIYLPLDLALPGDIPPNIAPHWFNPGERGPWALWTAAQWRHYQMTHHSNPPSEPSSGLQTVFAGNDLVSAFALRDGPQGKVLSFASLRADEELGWIGGRAELLAPTLAAALRRAAALGWSKATLEVDDDDHALWTLAETLPKPQNTYVTWQLERHPAHRPH